MRKFTRAAAPEFLREKEELWGREWAQRRAADPGAGFHWHEVECEAVNLRLMPLLKAQVQDHCSFCDNYPVAPPSRDTIDHFRPKARFPLEAYRWENLYYCCDWCQAKKREDFDEALLRPDAEDYAFDRFFRWDYTLGTLEVNDRASPEDQRRAEVTRRLYHLNDGHPWLRLLARRGRSRNPDKPIDECAYRDFVEPQPMPQDPRPAERQRPS
jgi:uncharacterized protein (TIGR02646 family)